MGSAGQEPLKIQGKVVIKKQMSGDLNSMTRMLRLGRLTKLLKLTRLLRVVKLFKENSKVFRYAK